MRSLAIALLALVAATPAHANWYGFKWGMSENSVAAVKSEVEVYRLKNAKRKKMRPVSSTFGGRWSVDGQDYQAYFYFSQSGELEFIDIEPVGVECSKINDLFAAQHGEYEEKIDSVGPARRTVRTWKLGKRVELRTLVLLFPGDGSSVCQATIKKPVGR